MNSAIVLPYIVLLRFRINNTTYLRTSIFRLLQCSTWLQPGLWVFQCRTWHVLQQYKAFLHFVHLFKVESIDAPPLQFQQYSFFSWHERKTRLVNKSPRFRIFGEPWSKFCIIAGDLFINVFFFCFMKVYDLSRNLREKMVCIVEYIWFAILYIATAAANVTERAYHC